MPFELTQIDHESGVSIIALSGKLTMGSQPMDLVWAIDGLLKQQKNRIVLDFAEVAYMDSAALGELRLASPTERVVSILKIARLYDHIGPDASRDISIQRLTTDSSA
jgi:hypothetical protein